MPPPPPAQPPAAAPGLTDDSATAGLAALSLHPPGPGDGAAAGGDAHAAARTTPPPSGAAAVKPVPAPLPSPGGSGGAAPAPGACPSGPIGDDGAALSAEVAASPFSPPATERHAAFLKLVDTRIKASLQGRDMRDADFSNLAAEAGAPLFGDESLIVAGLRATQAKALCNQAVMEADRGHPGAEVKALFRRSWAVLIVYALPVLQSRMDKDSLLPGKLLKVEEACYLHQTQLASRVMNEPIPSAAVLEAYAATHGFNAALQAAATALDLLPLLPWRLDQRERAQAFVLAALRLFPKTAGQWVVVHYENELVGMIEHGMTPARYGANFCTSVLAIWRSPAVADVLRSRGSLQSGVSHVAAANAEYAALQAADEAKKRLRRCALPACGKQETMVLQFRVCGHCQRTRYCCSEHAKQHWKVHKREYEDDEEERGDAGGGGGGP